MHHKHRLHVRLLGCRQRLLVVFDVAQVGLGLLRGAVDAQRLLQHQRVQHRHIQRPQHRRTGDRRQVRVRAQRQIHGARPSDQKQRHRLLTAPRQLRLGLSRSRDRDLGDVKAGGQPRQQGGDIKARQAVQHAVGREHHQPRIGDVAKEDRAKLHRRVQARIARLAAQLLTQGQHRLVAVVAVGDVDAAIAQDALHGLNHRRVGQPPQLVLHAVGGPPRELRRLRL